MQVPHAAHPPTAAHVDGSHQHIRYAGFWIRFVAALVDALVTAIPAFVMAFMIPVLGPVAVYLLYKGFCIGNWNGQTVGKRVCGIKVVDQSLRPCTVGQGFGRTGAELLSGMILYVGYIMAAFDSRKLALHDRIASTLHIYCDETPSHPAETPQMRGGI